MCKATTGHLVHCGHAVPKSLSDSGRLSGWWCLGVTGPARTHADAGLGGFGGSGRSKVVVTTRHASEKQTVDYSMVRQEIDIKVVSSVMCPAPGGVHPHAQAS
eukprot:7959201-Pyramimonas_sp.AAC.1